MNYKSTWADYATAILIGLALTALALSYFDIFWS
jgi:hypothetical protein